MKLVTNDPNYCATVVRVNSLVPLKGLDNLVQFPCFGFSALVGKDTEVGQLGILFTAETQLSEEFASFNNLFRHSEKNRYKERVGYLEDSCRVRTITLRKHPSSAIFVPLSSVSYLGDPNELKEGDCFNEIDGKMVCQKYVVKQTNSSKGPNASKNKELRKSRIESKLMPEHVSTSHYLKCENVIDDNTDIVVTAKLHGSSFRLANQLCDRKLTKKEKWLKWFGFKVQEHEYDYFAGSRRVIKDLSRKNLIHFYDLDIWNQTLERYKNLIPKGFVVMGELVGWAGDKPIQKHYTYRIEKGTFEAYVYRVLFVNPDGITVDLSWDQVKEFCSQTGMKHVPELWRGRKKDVDVNVYSGKKFLRDMHLTQCLPLDDTAPCDEGVVLRVDKIAPSFYKFKSEAFRKLETAGLDAGEIDMESAESE
jgi:hypothetical protein